jgi:plasmid stabilization system protein ParE
MSHRIAPEAEHELDEIWYFVAVQSGNLEIADRLIDSITDRFLLLSHYPHIGRGRDHDLRPGLRSFAIGEFVIFYRVEGTDVLILHVMRGSRDLEVLLK